MLVSSRDGRVQPTFVVYFGGSPIQEVCSQRHLDITLTSNLSWSIRVENIVNKAENRVDIIAYLQYCLDHSSLETIYSPDSKVRGANIGTIWGRQDAGGPHVGPMNFAIWAGISFAQF